MAHVEKYNICIAPWNKQQSLLKHLDKAWWENIYNKKNKIYIVEDTKYWICSTLTIKSFELFEKLKPAFANTASVFVGKVYLSLTYAHWNTQVLIHLWSFLTSVQILPPPPSRYRTSFCLKKSLCACKQSMPGPRSSPLIWYLILWKGLHINGIIQYTLFCVWLHLLSTIFLGFIQFVAYIGNLL